MKIVNKIERRNFCFNELLNKFNSTVIQTYKVEEQTFGTPCIRSHISHVPRGRASGFNRPH